jgi:probable phosphoglycerate mutase
MSLGAWEGMTREEVESAYPDVADDDAWWFRAPGGESYSQLKARIEEWISSLTSPVIAVSHGMAGRLIRGLLLGLPTEEALTLPSPQDVVWHLADHRIEALTLIP